MLSKWFSKKWTQDLLFYMASENTTESWVLEGSSKANAITLPRGTSVLLRAGPFPRSSSHLSLATHDDYNQVLVFSVVPDHMQLSGGI